MRELLPLTVYQFTLSQMQHSEETNLCGPTMGWSVNLTTLFLGRLRPPKHLPVLPAHTIVSNSQLPFLNQQKEKRKYVARPGIEPRTSDLWVRCPTDCATRRCFLLEMPYIVYSSTVMPRWCILYNINTEVHVHVHLVNYEVGFQMQM